MQADRACGEASAVSIQIRRGDVHVTVTVRASRPVCPGRLLAERAKEIRGARAFVGQEEEAYLAYFDVVLRTCSSWADGDSIATLPLPPFAGRTGLRKVGGRCLAADRVVSRGLAGPPALPLDDDVRGEHEVGAYRPRPRCLFRLFEAPTYRTLRLIGETDRGVEVDAEFNFERTAGGDATKTP